MFGIKLSLQGTQHISKHKHIYRSRDSLTEGIYDQDTAVEDIIHQRGPSRIIIYDVHAMLCSYPPEKTWMRLIPSEST